MKTNVLTKQYRFPRSSRRFYIDDYLFFISFALWLTVILLNRYTFFVGVVRLEVANFTAYACIAVMALGEVLSVARGQRWTWKSFVALGVCIVIGVCFYRGDIIAMVYAAPILFCARNRDVRVIFKIAAAVYLCILIATVLCAQLGLIDNITQASGDRERHLVGFRYPLYPATFLFLAICLVIAVKGRELDGYAGLLMLLGATLVFFLSVSRLSFGLALCAVAAFFVFGKVFKPGKANPAVAGVLAACIALCAVLSIGISLAYDPSISWMEKIDSLFEDRLTLGHNGLENFGLTILGQHIDLVSGALNSAGKPPSGTYNFIDSIYVQFAVRIGIVFLVIYVGGLGAATYKAFRQGEWLLGFMLILIAGHGIVDNQTLYLWMNPFMFCAMSLLSEVPHDGGFSEDGEATC